MRLIDADALLEEETTGILEYFDGYCEFGYSRKQIEEAATIDAVEVVRCKDCRWWDKREGSNYGYCHAAKHGYYSRNWEISIYRTYGEDFFCADGEVREDDG